MKASADFYQGAGSRLWVTALKGWTPSAFELLTSAGLADDSSKPQADVSQQRSSDLQGSAFPELFLGLVAFPQDKTILRLQAWSTSPLHDLYLSKSLKQATVDFRFKTNATQVRPLTASVSGCLQAQASITFRWHLQRPAAIKAGSFSHTHINTTNVTLIPISWPPFPHFPSFHKLLFHMFHPNPASPRNTGKRTGRKC